MHLIDILASLVILGQLCGMGAVTWAVVTRLSRRPCPQALRGWGGWLSGFGLVYVALGMFDAPALWGAAMNEVADIPPALLFKSLSLTCWLWLVWWGLIFRARRLDK